MFYFCNLFISLTDLIQVCNNYQIVSVYYPWTNLMQSFYDCDEVTHFEQSTHNMRIHALSRPAGAKIQFGEMLVEERKTRSEIRERVNELDNYHKLVFYWPADDGREVRWEH